MTNEKTEHALANARGWIASIREMVAKLDAADKANRQNDFDDARAAIEESPLSVLVRGPWYVPGAEPAPPDAFEVLLTTGGPALRIRGELDRHATATAFRFEAQDWGIPWFEVAVSAEDQEAIETYLGYLYFGEGG